MIHKNLGPSNSDWDVLKLKDNNNNSFIKDSGSHSKKILPTAKRKQSNINDLLLAVGSKLSDRKGPYTEMVFKPSGSSTPRTKPRDEPLPKRGERSQQHHRHFEFTKRRSLSTSCLPSSPRNLETIEVVEQILKQEMLTIRKYVLNEYTVKVLVLEDIEL